jgi:hypothetical protein
MIRMVARFVRYGKEGRMRVVVVVLALWAVGCGAAIIVAPPEGKLAGGECTCSVCWDRPFCLDEATGQAQENPDQVDCPPEFPTPSVGASRVTDLFEREGFWCIEEHPGHLIGGDDATCADLVIGEDPIGTVDPCEDLPQCARDEGCPEPPLPDERCSDQRSGSLRVACGDDAGGLGAVRAMDEIIDSCSMHSVDVPSAAPARFCYIVCLHPDESCVPDSGQCRLCDPEAFDPPGTDLDSVMLPIDAETSIAQLFLQVEEEVDDDTVPVDGVIALTLPRECIGPLPDGEIEICEAAIPLIDLRTTENPRLFDTSLRDVRVINPQPIEDSMLTAGGISILSLPENSRFYATGDVEGEGVGEVMFESPSLAAFIDWEARRLTAFTVAEDTNAVLFLSLDATIPNLPPAAAAGPDQVLECSSPSGAVASLSAAASSDPDGADDLVSFRWTWHVDGTIRMASGSGLEAPLPLGETSVALVVRDADGAGDVDSTVVRVVDSSPPVIGAVELSTGCLWPPNHSMRLFRLGEEIRASASDACGGPAAVRVVEVRSNQPADSTGDGATSPDVRFGSAAFCVRAERSGNARAPRQYTVVLEATDGAGNSARTEVVLEVPHDQSPDDRCLTGDLVQAVPDDDERCVAELLEGRPAIGYAAAGSPGPGAGGCGVGPAAPGGPAACSVLALLLLAWRSRRS